MMKWFRKYNKEMLAALVVFLMVVFLVGDTIGNRNSENNPVWATVHGKTLHESDRRSALGTIEILKTLALPIGGQLQVFPWNAPWIMLTGNQRQLREPLSAEEFALLDMEARSAGFEVPSNRIDQIMNLVPPQYVVQARKQLNVTEAHVREAVASWVRIFDHGISTLDVIHTSEDQIRHTIRDISESVKFSYVNFKAADFVDDAQNFTEQEIRAHFDLYRDKVAGDDGAEFGYRWPRRIRLEFLAVDVAEIEPTIEVSTNDARAYYRQNLAQFTEEVPASQPADATSTAPAPQPTIRQQSFADAKPKIIEILRNRTATARARDFIEQAVIDLSRPWDSTKRDATGFKTTPAGVDAPSYMEDTARELSAHLPITMKYVRTKLLNKDEILTTDGLGERVDPVNRGFLQGLSVTDYLFRLPGFYEVPKDRLESELTLSIYQPTLTAYGVLDSEGRVRRLIIPRVCEVHEAAPPITLEEVTDLVIRDLRIKAAEASAKSHAEKLYASAAVGGLRTAIDANAELKSLLIEKIKADIKSDADEETDSIDPLVTTAALTRRFPYLQIDFPMTVDGLGEAPEVLDTAFAMTEPGFEPAPIPTTEAPVNVPATMPAPIVTLMHRKTAHQYLVMEMRDHKPVRENDYLAQRTQVRQQLQVMRQVQLISDWFNADSIKTRLEYIPARPTLDDPDKEIDA